MGWLELSIFCYYCSDRFDFATVSYLSFFLQCNHWRKFIFFGGPLPLHIRISQVYSNIVTFLNTSGKDLNPSFWSSWLSEGIFLVLSLDIFLPNSGFIFDFLSFLVVKYWTRWDSNNVCRYFKLYPHFKCTCPASFLTTRLWWGQDQNRSWSCILGGSRMLLFDVGSHHCEGF